MVGTTISHYRILEKLGEGGMGVVYKAQDTKLNRTVALKFLPSHLTVNETERARFLQEAQAASILSHPNICVIHAIGEHEGRQFIDMEFVDGRTLRDVSVTGGSASGGKLDTILSYALQIGEALQEAHSKGIVHRDVKAENIMVDSKNRIKVMDFGLAKLKGSLKLTKTSSTIGTLAYMAPEQIQGEEVDARSDIFSYGALLFELFTGRLPFRGEHEAAMMYSILNEPPESLLKIRPDAPPEVERILHRALQKDPADRYQHIDDMVSELRLIQKTRLSTASGRIVRPVQEEHDTDRLPPPAAESPAMSRAGIRSNRSLLWLAGAIVVLIGIGAYYLFILKPRPSITSMAVLPFANTGSDPNAEVLSDGFTENLINGLSRLPGIKMMSRSSVFRFKGKDIDPREVGKQLGVGAVLMGRMSQRGDALSVSVELVDTRDNSHIWGEQYDRKSSEILSLQSEIAKDMSKQLGIALTGAQERQLTKKPTENTEAYQYYVQGRFYWNKRTRDGFEKAAQYFQRAIQTDSSYAQAYAGLADVYSLMGGYFILPPREAAEKCRVTVRKALALDESMAEAHTTLAALYDNFEWDWANAEREYKRALELNPNYATAHQWYGEFLGALGRIEEGILEIRKAEELDPLAPILYVAESYALVPLHRYDEAIERSRRALEIDPAFPRGHSALGTAYFVSGRYDEAIAEISRAYASSDSSLEYLAQLGHVYARIGKTEEAMNILNRFLQLSKDQYVAPYFIGQLYTGLGKTDEAFTWFNRAVDEHANAMEYLRLDPTFDPIRNDPRFTVLMKKVGLEQ